MELIMLNRKNKPQSSAEKYFKKKHPTAVFIKSKDLNIINLINSPSSKPASRESIRANRKHFRLQDTKHTPSQSRNLSPRGSVPNIGRMIHPFESKMTYLSKKSSAVCSPKNREEVRKEDLAGFSKKDYKFIYQVGSGGFGSVWKVK